MAQKQYRIISDGTLYGTTVLHIPSGAELHVSGVSWECKATDFQHSKVLLEIPLSLCEVDLASSDPAEVVLVDTMRESA